MSKRFVVWYDSAGERTYFYTEGEFMEDAIKNWRKANNYPKSVIPTVVILLTIQRGQTEEE